MTPERGSTSPNRDATNSTAAPQERLSSLRELSMVRFKEFMREPEAVFWVFAFPILLAVGLGIAFRNKPADIVHVAVVRSSASAAATVAALRAAPGLAVDEAPTLDSAQALLRDGRIALAVLPQDTGGVEYRYDDTRPDARSARFLVNDAIQRADGRRDPVATHESFVRDPGSRYIDFLIPGLIGMNIMGSSIWGMGFTIVDARRKKLLKRLVATPMSRVEYLASFIISRLSLLVVEVLVVLGFGMIAFGVPMRGSVLQFVLVIVLSAFAFGSLGLLIASRAQTIEGASGIMNVAMMPMWVLSGVFFSSENFPRAFQPIIRALPLTATINALRATMLRGEGWHLIRPEVAVLAAWTVIAGWIALRIFRWR